MAFPPVPSPLSPLTVNYTKERGQKLNRESETSLLTSIYSRLQKPSSQRQYLDLYAKKSRPCLPTVDKNASPLFACRRLCVFVREAPKMRPDAR